jgi:hypothetical protein
MREHIEELKMSGNWDVQQELTWAYFETIVQLLEEISAKLEPKEAEESKPLIGMYKLPAPTLKGIPKGPPSLPLN